MYAGVVVAYNPEKEEILKNIETYVSDLDVLYIVDNSKKSNEKMFENLNNVKYIANNDNLGISAALNIGARMAIHEGHSWLFDNGSR